MTQLSTGSTGATGPKVTGVLFLCTHNSARSIMAESILDDVGRGKFRGYSAGSHPAAAPNPLALATLRLLGLPTERLYSKDWTEFARAGAPEIDFVITVCDNAAGEVCPVWPGRPIAAHWGVEDPSRFEGSEADRLKEFARVALILKRRIELFTSLQLATLDRRTLKRELEMIGRERTASRS